MATRKLTTHHTPAQRRAFGYARVSTDSQAGSGLSIDEQRTKIKARCVENGWQLERIYTDAGISGSTPLDRRPQGRPAASRTAAWRYRRQPPHGSLLSFGV